MFLNIDYNHAVSSTHKLHGRQYSDVPERNMPKRYMNLPYRNNKPLNSYKMEKNNFKEVSLERHIESHGKETAEDGEEYLITKCKSKDMNTAVSSDTIFLQGNNNLKLVFNEKFKHSQKNIVYNMQDLHNRASERIFWDESIHGNNQNRHISNQNKTTTSVTNYTKGNFGECCSQNMLFSTPCKRTTNNHGSNQSTNKRFRYEDCVTSYICDKKSKVSKIDEIFDIFIPAMRTTIVTPEFITMLINLHKNNNGDENQEISTAMSANSHTGAPRKGQKLKQDDLLAHFNSLDDSFKKFAHANKIFEDLCWMDQEELLNRNSLLFTMVNIHYGYCHASCYYIYCYIYKTQYCHK